MPKAEKSFVPAHGQLLSYNTGSPGPPRKQCPGLLPHFCTPSYTGELKGCICNGVVHGLHKEKDFESLLCNLPQRDPHCACRKGLKLKNIIINHKTSYETQAHSTTKEASSWSGNMQSYFHIFHLNCLSIVLPYFYFLSVG